MSDTRRGRRIYSTDDVPTDCAFGFEVGWGPRQAESDALHVGLLDAVPDPHWTS